MILAASSSLHTATILRHEKLEVPTSSQQKNRSNFNPIGICSGLDYKSKPFQISNDSILFQSINNENDFSPSTLVVPNFFQVNKLNLISAGLKDDTIKNSTKKNAAADTFRFIPFKHKSALSIDKCTAINKNDYTSTININATTTNSTITNITSLSSVTATAITSAPVIDKYNNKLVIIQLLLEEELLCITRGPTDIEKFEVKGLLTLNAKLNKMSTLYIDKMKNNSKMRNNDTAQSESQLIMNSLRKSLNKSQNNANQDTSPYMLKSSLSSSQIAGGNNSMSANPISSLFDELHLQDDDENEDNDDDENTDIINNNNNSRNKKKNKKCFESMKMKLKMAGIANSIEKVDINRKFVQYLPDINNDDESNNDDNHDGKDDVGYKNDVVSVQKENAINNKNNLYSKGLENQYKVETVELPLIDNRIGNKNNNHNNNITTTAVMTYPLVRYYLASNFKFMLLKATSQISQLTTSSGTSASNTNTAANIMHSLSTNNKTQLKITVQVRLNPNFKETLSDIYVLASIKKLLKQQQLSLTTTPYTLSAPLSASATAAGSNSSGNVLASIQEDSVLEHNTLPSSLPPSTSMQQQPLYAINNVTQFTPQTANYNKQEYIITWRVASSSAVSGTGESVTAGTQVPLLTFQAIIDIAPVRSLQPSDSTALHLNEYKLLTTTVPIIVKAKYQQALITKTKFSLDGTTIECDDGRNVISVQDDCFAQDTYRAKLEYRFLEHD